MGIKAYRVERKKTSDVADQPQKYKRRWKVEAMYFQESSGQEKAKFGAYEFHIYEIGGTNNRRTLETKKNLV